MKKLISNETEGLYALAAILGGGQCSRLMNSMVGHGIIYSFSFFVKGSQRNHLLEVLGLENVRKEMHLAIADRTHAKETIDVVSKCFQMEKANHGIAFTFRINALPFHPEESNGAKDMDKIGGNHMYYAIFTIVESGYSDDVVEAAEAAGSRGATIINARGSSTKEKQHFFNLVVEPEKEIVMIISERDSVERISQAIENELDLEKPNKGILFTVPLEDVRGLAR